MSMTSFWITQALMLVSGLIGYYIGKMGFANSVQEIKDEIARLTKQVSDSSAAPAPAPAPAPTPAP